MSAFGKTSLERLATAHDDLQRVMNEAIKDCPIDFMIVCGVRGRADQEAAKAGGKSKAGFGKSPHNFRPSFAVDVAPIVNGKPEWNDTKPYVTIANHIMDVAETLGIDLIWGGDFHDDGNATVNDAWDKPHFEIADWRNLKQLAELAE